MKVIFLDMDGVMNSHQFFSTSSHDPSIDGDGPANGFGFGAAQIDPAAVALLNQLVEAADAYIVISSSWRHIWPFQEVAEMLEQRGFKHADRVIGQTPQMSQAADSRGAEVREWLDLGRERMVADPDQEPTTSYVILDDCDEFDHEQRQRFVRTSAQTGLTAKDVQRAIQILSREG